MNDGSFSGETSIVDATLPEKVWKKLPEAKWKKLREGLIALIREHKKQSPTPLTLSPTHWEAYAYEGLKVLSPMEKWLT